RRAGPVVRFPEWRAVPGNASPADHPEAAADAAGSAAGPDDEPARLRPQLLRDLWRADAAHRGGARSVLEPDPRERRAARVPPPDPLHPRAPRQPRALG